MLVQSLVLLAALGVADPPVRYTVALPAPQTQMVEMRMRIDDVAEPELTLQLPAWRPGRYVILDPAGTLRGLAAQGPDGRALAVTKTAKATWTVATAGATSVELTYRIYANSISDRTRHVDDTHAFLSPSSVFLYDPTRRDHPVEVTIEAPADWGVATGLESIGGDPRRRRAPDYDVLVDSPLELGLHDVHTFEVDGRPHEIVVWPRGIAYDTDRLVGDTRDIVEATRAIFGRLPYDRYVFLIHVGAGGGGTEHLNSTIMQTGRVTFDDSFENGDRWKGFLGLVAHEFFHTWNVKQLRPEGITPYDYQRENYTKLLWVAEGTTSYYDEIIPVRAGLVTPKKYLQRLGNSINALKRTPGARVQSLAESSFDAWIKFNRRTPDAGNSTISFYSKGALVSLVLDLELRKRTAGAVTLDDVMRTLFERFPLDQGGFGPDDLAVVLAERSGSDFGPFLARYVDSTAPLPFEEVLGVVGLELRFEPKKKADEADDDETDDDDGEADDAPPKVDRTLAPDAELPMRASLGLALTKDGGRTLVRSVRSDGAAYTAGLQPGDEIVALDGRRLGAGDLQKRLERHAPGDPVRVTIFRRDALRTLVFDLGAEPDGKWIVRRLEDLSAAAQAQWESWLGESARGGRE